MLFGGPLLAAVVIALAAPGAGAKSYQGSISPPVVGPDGRSVSAQVSMTSSCTAGEYCGFFAEVMTVQDSEPCRPVITGSGWVSTVVFSTYGSTSETLPTATATWSEYPSLYAGGKRACLYGEIGDVLVAQAVYQVPQPAPVPSYTPTPTVTPVPSQTPAPAVPQTVTIPIPGLPFLSRTDGVEETRRWIKRKYGHRWTKGSRRTVRCPVRASDAQLGCVAAWSYKYRGYSKAIVLTEDTYGDFTVSRDFASAPTQVQTVTVPSTSPTSSTDFCSTHVCIPNYDNGTGSTVQCSDGSYSHSGGKQGACSYHGGVGHLALARRARLLAWSARASRHQTTLTRALGLVASRSS